MVRDKPPHYNEDPDPIVDSLAYIVSRLDSTTTQFTVDFLSSTSWSCWECATHTQWEALVVALRQRSGKEATWISRPKTSRNEDYLDVRLNFAVSTAPVNGHRADPNYFASRLVSSLPLPQLSECFSGWYAFDYEPYYQATDIFRHCIHYSVHSTWPHPLPPSELELKTLD
ncbi:hypothetical protein CVT24_005033 [Panaeolus cyanescens]|uniref:Uncharacterized protein n=1 Tax=Panaeolus cyanescens TaxID=181874 RepID=A0A409YBB4_9AGAR|nr:hypothetical protein CVT24_005033 [Panaeolus cyanescens]